MADCERLSTCCFFKNEMERMPASAEWLKTYYCRDRFVDCARWQVIRALGQVPRDLFPHQGERARAILSDRDPGGQPAAAVPSPGSPEPPR